MNKYIKLFLVLMLMFLFAIDVKAIDEEPCIQNTIYKKSFDTNLDGVLEEYTLICLTGVLMEAYKDIRMDQNYILDSTKLSDMETENSISVEYRSIPEFYNKLMESPEHLHSIGSQGQKILEELIDGMNDVIDDHDVYDLPDTVCKYGEYTLTFNTKSKTISASPGTLVGLDYERLMVYDYKCPPEFCVVNGAVYFDGSNCTYLDGTKEAKANIGKTVPLDTSHSKSESERDYEGALDEGMIKVINLLKNIYNALIILVPIALLVFGVVDLLKAVGSQDEKAMKAAQSALGRRVMWAIVALLAFNIMKLVFTIFEGGSEWLKYWW